MNKAYKIQLPRNKEAQNIKTNIKDGTIEVSVELNEKWEPRDGEIYYTNTDYAEYIFIAKKILSDHIATDIILRDKEYLSVGFDFDVFKEKTNLFRPATDSEKQLLFDTLAKEGKMWDAQKKQVVDLPRWRADKNEYYFFIYWNPSPKVTRATDIRLDCDNRHYNMCNYFKTREAAERVAEQIREIFKNSKAE